MSPDVTLRRALSLLAGSAILLVTWPLRGDFETAHRRTELPGGCGACHRGHGFRRTMMLNNRQDALCFNCHSDAPRRAVEQRRGALSQAATLRDVSGDFRLPFRHPIERSPEVHMPGEQLPEKDPNKPRHVQCVDCHSAHFTRRVSTFAPSRLSRRSSLDGQSPEYVLCYRCHSDSANLPRTASNLRLRFSMRNASYHPVETSGRGTNVPSLRAPLTSASLISCGDCHGNDSGRGMHGSRYPFLLRLQYVTTGQSPESPQTYALCYDCHDRRAIFGTRSFSEHDRHVRKARISCAACHNAHGSFTNPFLIEFSPQVARPDTQTGRLAYVSRGPGAGVCWVNCHGVNHSETPYCVNRVGCASETRRRAPPAPDLQPIRQQLKGSPFSF